MKDIIELDVKHLNTKKQAFGAFKAVRHRMVKNYLGIEQNWCSFCADAHAVRGVLFDLGQRVKTVIQRLYLSLVLRKPVFGVSDQVPHKPGYTATDRQDS